MNFCGRPYSKKTASTILYESAFGYLENCQKEEFCMSHVIKINSKYYSADPCVIPRNLLVKIDFIVLSGRFGCQ